jgi:tRNA-specific 2-thiouridylase
VSGQAPDQTIAYGAKTRYRQEDAPCVLNLNQEITGLEQFSLDFNQNQWAITPGQSAVLYLNEVCLGGGIII